MSATAKSTPATKLQRPSSRADLEKRRKGVQAQGPSGEMYRVRKVNLRRHMGAGGLPAGLSSLARAAVTAQMGGSAPEISDEDIERMMESRVDSRDYDDRLILATVIEPVLTVDDLGSGDLDDDPIVPAIDQEWLVDLAHGRQTRDARGLFLWGPEPGFLALDIYQSHHDCGEDCAECASASEAIGELIRARA